MGRDKVNAMILAGLLVLSIVPGSVGAVAPGMGQQTQGALAPQAAGNTDTTQSINGTESATDSNAVNQADIRAIERAYREGELSYSKAKLYKYRAVTGQAQDIPDTYLSDESAPPIKSGTSIVREIAGNYSRLSAAVKTELQESPAGNTLTHRPGSCPSSVACRPGQTLPQTYETQHFVIHYTNGSDGGKSTNRPDSRDANNNGVPDEVEEIGDIYEHVWAEETSTYPTVSSDSSEPSIGTGVNPNGKYDVFLRDISAYGYTAPEDGSSGARPTPPYTSSYIVHDVDMNVGGLTETQAHKVTAAHEFFHAIQFDSYNQDDSENGWWVEASATWMEDKVYPSINDYQQYVNSGNPNWIDDPGKSMTKKSYSNVIFVKYLAQTYGTDTVRHIWEEMKNDDGTAAVDAALQSHKNTDLKTAFKGFGKALIANNRNNSDGNRNNDQFTDGDDFSDVTISDRTTFTGGTYAHSSNVEQWGINYIKVTPKTDHLYYDVTCLSAGCSANDFWQHSIRETSKSIITRRAGNDAAINATAIRTQRNESTVPNVGGDVDGDNQTSEAGKQAANSRTPLGWPPIQVNNTVTNADEYDSLIVAASPLGRSKWPIQRYKFTVEKIPSNNRFSTTLDAGEAATYAIPVNIYRQPNIRSVFEHNGDVYTSVWPDGSGSVDATLTRKRGSDGHQVATPSDVTKAELLGKNGKHTSGIWSLTISGSTSGSTTVNVASSYLEGGVGTDQMFGLPSSASITPGDMVAGDPKQPEPITFDVTVETGDKPYQHSPFDPLKASDFAVTVGKKSVSSSKITTTKQSQDTYTLEFVPPTQKSKGSYNLSVNVSDEKFGVSRTVGTSLNKAVNYTKPATALIIDESGSMDDNSKMANAKSAASQYVSLLGSGDQVAAISFDSYAATIFSMARATPSNKSTVKLQISGLSAGGGTDIGDGLSEGYSELSTVSSSTPKAAILLSDGKARYPAGVVQSYKNSNISIYTVALGSGADTALLSRIARETGGSFTSTSNPAALQQIYADISQNISGASTVSSTSGTVPPQNTATKQFPIDSTTSAANVRVRTGQGGSSTPKQGTEAQTQTQTQAQVQAQKPGGSPQVVLQYPNGTQVQLNSSTVTGTENSNITYTRIDNTTTYRIEDPTAGTWTYAITNNKTSTNLSYNATVTGTSATKMSLSTDAREYVTGSTTTLQTTLVSTSGGVSGATVTANITQPDGNTTTLQLKEQKQGTYSVAVPNTQSGAVTATVEVSSGQVTRQKTVRWTVVNNSTVLQVESLAQSTPTTTQGGTATAEFNISRPTAQTSPRAGDTAGSANATTNATRNFERAVTEVANSEPGTYNESAVDPAVRQAAAILRNETQNETNASNTTTATNVSTSTPLAVSGANSGSKAYIQKPTLAGPNGTTIPAKHVQVSDQVVALQPGDNRTVRMGVSVPVNTTSGTYTGQMQIAIDGTVVTEQISVEVTNATTQTFIGRIQTAHTKWKNTTTAGKDYYEGQIADHLTAMYFDNTSFNTQSTTASTQQTNTSMKTNKAASES